MRPYRNAVYDPEVESSVSPSRVQENRDGNLNAYLYGDVDYDWRESIIIPLYEKLDSLTRMKEPSATFYISSNGGYTSLMWDIVEWMERAKASEVTVRTVVTSHAYSAGSVIAVSGSAGERYIGKRASHLIHYGQGGGYLQTTPLQVERDAKFMKRHFATILAHYKAYCDIPDLTKLMMDDGLTFNAAESIKYKLADKYTAALEG